MFFRLGITDDDIIALGVFELSPITTNFLENTIISLLIGLPVIYKEFLQEKIELKLAFKEKELEKVYKMKVESELAAIHAKINPHFLYNSLNSIVSLIHLDPDRAEKMVLSLSDLFRYSINSSENHFASIRDEVRLIKTYLEIEHVRFEDQLIYTIDVDDDLLDKHIPKFLLNLVVLSYKHVDRMTNMRFNEGIFSRLYAFFEGSSPSLMRGTYSHEESGEVNHLSH